MLFVDEEWDSGREAYIYISLVFNADGKLIEENAVFDEQAGVHGSCSTMLNGEAIIFGGWNNLKRQVN